MRLRKGSRMDLRIFNSTSTENQHDHNRQDGATLNCQLCFCIGVARSPKEGHKAIATGYRYDVDLVYPTFQFLDQLSVFARDAVQCLKLKISSQEFDSASLVLRTRHNLLGGFVRNGWSVASLRTSFSRAARILSVSWTTQFYCLNITIQSNHAN
jgi:hypothetical protein